METLIKQHVRKGKNQRNVGVLVGLKTDSGNVNIGWSKCTLKREGKPVDTYNRDRGIEIAVGRAIDPKDHGNIPHLVKSNLDAFKDRCKRYFKTKAIVVHGEPVPVVKSKKKSKK